MDLEEANERNLLLWETIQTVGQQIGPPGKNAENIIFLGCLVLFAKRTIFGKGNDVFRIRFGGRWG